MHKIVTKPKTINMGTDVELHMKWQIDGRISYEELEDFFKTRTDNPEEDLSIELEGVKVISPEDPCESDPWYAVAYIAKETDVREEYMEVLETFGKDVISMVVDFDWV